MAFPRMPGLGSSGASAGLPKRGFVTRGGNPGALGSPATAGKSTTQLPMNRYKEIDDRAEAARDPGTHVPPWLMPERPLNRNTGDDIGRSIAGQRGWMHPRQIHSEAKQMEMSRTMRPATARKI